VKYGFPMAFTVTVLAWGALHYERELEAAGEIAHVREAIKWGTNYFLKASATPNQLWVQVIIIQSAIYVRMRCQK